MKHFIMTLAPTLKIFDCRMTDLLKGNVIQSVATWVMIVPPWYALV